MIFLWDFSKHFDYFFYYRFGAGIIIYWFGYHESTPKLPDNSIGIIVLDDFPLKSDIQFLDLSENIESVDEKDVEETWCLFKFQDL